MKTKVLLDMDGVVANFYEGFSKFLNKNYGCTLDPYQEPENYSIEDWGNGAEKVDFVNTSKHWIEEGGFASIPAFEGAEEFVRELSNMCDIHVVTARIGDWQQSFSEELMSKIRTDTAKWLENHGMPADKLFFEHEKPAFCVELGIPIMIEDKLNTALRGAKEGLHTVLINRGYNGSQMDRFRVYRVYNYQEALDQIRKLAGR